jgi:hypothetical protein
MLNSTDERRSCYSTDFTMKRISPTQIYPPDKESENLPLAVVRRYPVKNPEPALNKCAVPVWICCKVRTTLEPGPLTIMKCHRTNYYNIDNPTCNGTCLHDRCEECGGYNGVIY